MYACKRIVIEEEFVASSERRIPPFNGNRKSSFCVFTSFGRACLFKRDFDVLLNS